MRAWASPEVVEKIVSLGRESAEEVCGVVLPDCQVVALPNTATTDRSRAYVIQMDDLLDTIVSWAEEHGKCAADLDTEDVIIWHTHPSGNVGASPGDLDARVEGFRYLVVALPDGQATMF